MRLPLERAVQVTIATMILAVAVASSSIVPLIRWGGRVRSPILAILLALAVADAARAWRVGRLRFMSVLLGGSFVALALLSVSWSVDPGLTFERTLGFGAMITAAAAVSFAATARHQGAEHVLQAVFAGAALVGLGGLVVLAVDRDAAVVRAFGTSPSLFRGLGVNPNTVPLLVAQALPIGVWLLFRLGSRAARAAVLALSLVLLGTIVFADARAAFGASFAGVALVALILGRTWRRKTAALAALVAVWGAAYGLGQIPQPRATLQVVPETLEAKLRGVSPRLACLRLPQDEVHLPPCATNAPPSRAGLIDRGRLDVWEGTLEQVAGRPLVGYGFGTEDVVFVDRYYLFIGRVVENAYLGLLLQLGAAGLALVLALVGYTVVSAWRGGRTGATDVRATCSAVVLAGMLLALFQSFPYSAGNIGALCFWLALFLLAAESR